MLELIEVSKSYAGVVALERCNLSIPAGRTSVLIGPSGSGKSTVLRLIIGLQVPDAGSIRFAGQRIDPDSLPALRRQMGYVIQDGGLFPHLSARENVIFAIRDCDRRERDDRAMALLEDLALAEAAGRRPSEISGG